jgi:hypothetical protein
MPDILQNFLSLGLLDIGDDDTRLAKLRDAASDLQKRLTTEPRVGLYHTLMLFSENVDGNDECFRENGEILEHHWPTYRNRHPDVPTTIFRAISFQALSGASKTSPQLQMATAYALRSIAKIPHPSKEGPLLAEFYAHSQSELEAKAIAKWQIGEMPPHIAAKTVSVAATQVNKATLEAAIMAASGPQNLQNQAIPNANPYWPNSAQQWSQQFAPKMTEALASTLDAIAKNSAAEVTKALKGITEQVTTVLSTEQQRWGDAMVSNSRRSELLWWRQSLYSPSMRRSYRDLRPAAAAIIMASDFAGLAESCAPVSADYFLRETVGNVLGDSKTAAWNDVLEQLDTEKDVKESFFAAVPTFAPRTGVKTIVEQIRDELSSGSAAKTKRGTTRSGKSGQEDLTLLAVRIYVALQALTAVAEKTDEKKV